MVKYTIENIGCFGDGSLGHEHVRRKLHDLLVEAECDDNELRCRLCAPMSDDASEEYEALDWLNENVCSDNVYFNIIDGDLILINTNESFSERYLRRDK